MIKTIGGLAYHRGEWRYWAGDVVVHCDAKGCRAKKLADSLEHNGPVVECIYGMDGWSLGEKDYCPKHAPFIAGS